MYTSNVYAYSFHKNFTHYSVSGEIFLESCVARILYSREVIQIPVHVHTLSVSLSHMHAYKHTHIHIPTCRKRILCLFLA